jgi:hypothetical protein
MHYVGYIEAEPDPPGIDKAAWIELIDRHPHLVRPGPSRGINPFTREPVEFRANPTAANLVIDGEDVGFFDWSQNEENVILVTGELPAIRRYAAEIAEQLGGRFVEECGT